MRKTVAALAILASVSSAHALIGPGGKGPGGTGAPRPAPKKVCLPLDQADDGSYQAGGCDMSARNLKFNSEIYENGCAEDQVAVSLVGVTVRSCPTYTQL